MKRGNIMGLDTKHIKSIYYIGYKPKAGQEKNAGNHRENWRRMNGRRRNQQSCGTFHKTFGF